MSDMSDRLMEIMAHKREEVKALAPHADELRQAALSRNEFRGFRSALNQPGETTIIAEVKKASPSAGLIAADFDPTAQAQSYQVGGASCLSVLTDEKYFQGSMKYLQDIRELVDLPVLRKDFTVDPLQVYETAACGADAILLIVAALNEQELDTLFKLSKDCQLDVLVEVHNMEELDRALDLGADIIGINNRNLKTFEIDLITTEELAAEIPNDCLAISESGIESADDVRFCHEQGIDCLLIGTSLMKSGDPTIKLRELLTAVKPASE